jgi:antitoxin component YwqK of YwqJK toxin-antitoxin module
MITTKNKFGLLHSIDDKPSLIDDDGHQYWHINGALNRSDITLPFIKKSNGESHYRLENGGYKITRNLEEKWLNKNNMLHRKDGPAWVSYHDNENIKYESYFINGKLNNIDGPAIRRYYDNRNIEFEGYSLNGKLHRKDGPSSVSYYENGNIKNEEYLLDGYYHRENGPAYIEYYENGNILSELYYLNDSEYSKEDYLEQIKELKSCNKMT